MLLHDAAQDTLPVALMSILLDSGVGDHSDMHMQPARRTTLSDGCCTVLCVGSRQVQSPPLSKSLFCPFFAAQCSSACGPKIFWLQT